MAWFLILKMSNDKNVEQNRYAFLKGGEVQNHKKLLDIQWEKVQKKCKRRKSKSNMKSR